MVKMGNRRLRKVGQDMLKKLTKIIFLFMMVVVVSLSSGITSFAYDLDAHHEVNADRDIEADKLVIWKYIRSRGYSEHATAGIMGNIQAECSYNCTLTESGVAWSASAWNSSRRGFGLIQWTSLGRKQLLLDAADANGTQWTDLNTQLQAACDELDGTIGAEFGSGWFKGGTRAVIFNSLDEFKESEDITACVKAFCWGFERPAERYAHEDRRISEANAAYEQFKGTAIDGSTDTSEETDEEGTVVKDFILDEWDLEGMPTKSKLQDNAVIPTIPDFDSLSSQEAKGTVLIRENIKANTDYNLVDYIGVVFVFIGLVLSMYSVFLIACYFLDQFNTIIEISFLNLITFGRLSIAYSNDEYSKDKITFGRLVKIVVVLNLIAMLLIAGTLQNVISSIIDFIIREF